jgi:hypothetical protein
LAHDPAEFLELAREQLLKKPISERHCRCAARSAYYAVYHLIARLFGRNTAQYDGKHAIIREILLSKPSAQCLPVEKCAKIHWDQLFAFRVKADYQVTTVFTVVEARLAVAYAEKVFTNLT